MVKIAARCVSVFLALGVLQSSRILAQEIPTEIVRADAGLDRILDPNSKLEALQAGFDFTEGATWIGRKGQGKLYFTDIVANKIFTYNPRTKAVAVFADKTGYSGKMDGNAFATIGSTRDNGYDIKDPRYKFYALIGADGLGVDRKGLLIACTFAGRSMVRYNADHSITVLADRWEGKRFDGTNDVAVRKDNSVYFTDMVAGLRDMEKNPTREMTSMGIYRVRNGQVTRILSGLAWANGLAFSPDEKWLYANNTKIRNDISRYRVLPDGTVDPNGEVILDMNKLAVQEHLGEGKGVADGLRVDSEGNIYCAGPGGLWIFSPEGKHLGFIRTPEIVANFNFGDDDLKTIYLNGRTTLYKIRVKVPGSPTVD